MPPGRRSTVVAGMKPAAEILPRARPPDEAGEGPGQDEAAPRPIEQISNGSPAGARLLATQMAVSGTSRNEIESRLRNGFTSPTPRAILNAILGPED